MKEFFAQIQPDYSLKPHTEEDRIQAASYKPNQIVKVKVSGVRKHRAYRELCCYKGSCKYIASLNLDPNKDTPRKVDILTKNHCGFVDGTVYDEKTKQVYWIEKSLSYANCDQPEAHQFIKAALEEHAYLAGIDDVDQYVAMLRSL